MTVKRIVLGIVLIGGIVWYLITYWNVKSDRIPTPEREKTLLEQQKGF